MQRLLLAALGLVVVAVGLTTAVMSYFIVHGWLDRDYPVC